MATTTIQTSPVFLELAAAFSVADKQHTKCMELVIDAYELCDDTYLDDILDESRETEQELDNAAKALIVYIDKQSRAFGMTMPARKLIDNIGLGRIFCRNVIASI